MKGAFIPTKSKVNPITGEIINPTKKDVADFNAKYTTTPAKSMLPKSFVPKSFAPKAKNRNKVLGALKSIKDGVVSAPAVMKNKIAEDKANRAVARAKERRALKERDEAGVQDSGHYSDPLFRYRINAINEAFDKEKASAKDK